MQKIANYLTTKKTPYPSGGSWSQKCRGQMAILNGEIDSNQSSLYGRFGTGPFQDGRERQDIFAEKRLQKTATEEGKK
jgi:hypothetical protein